MSLFSRWSGMCIGLAVILVAVVTFLLSRPVVVDRALYADITHRYEWFFFTADSVNARVAQLNAHKVLIEAETVASEKSRQQHELTEMQQSCRDMVQQYNANASKANTAFFKTDATPANFSPSICE